MMDHYLSINNNNKGKLASETTHKRDFTNPNQLSWFQENLGCRIEDDKAAYSNIYDNTQNVPGENLDPVLQSESTVAANSLHNFVEEALRSVEDGIASLDHRELNMIVEKQNEKRESKGANKVENNYATN